MTDGLIASFGSTNEFFRYLENCYYIHLGLSDKVRLMRDIRERESLEELGGFLEYVFVAKIFLESQGYEIPSLEKRKRFSTAKYFS